MAWAGSYRATPAIQAFGNLATWSVNKAAGTVSGDLVLLWCSDSNWSGPAFSCPGFTAYTDIALNGYNPGQLLIRQADGTEGSTYAVNPGHTTHGNVVQTVIAGPCSIDVVGAANNAQNASPSATGLTVAGANELLLWFGGAALVSNGLGTLIATPSGFTSQFAGTAGTTDDDIVVKDNTAIAAGATGSIATTVSASSNWGAQMVAIKTNPVVATAGLLAFC